MSENFTAPWCVNILTLFPDMFPGPLQHSISGKSQEQLWKINTINIRDFAHDKHQTVDDKPYGGGAGMVIKPDILSKSINSIKNKSEIIYFSPRGELFNQHIAEELIQKNNLLFICGRYEGIDQRVIDHYNIREISIGDYVLSGGEIAAITVLDSCIRLLPEVIHNKSSLIEESFSTNSDYQFLLEYPHYTRPSTWNNMIVPEILLSGNHKKIMDWRLNIAKEITKNKRPDLWEKHLFKCNNVISDK